MLDGMITFLGILLAFLLWVDLILVLDKTKILERYNMSRIWGFALMWRTKKGTGLIEKISSPKKFWTWVGNIGFVAFFSGMVLMFILILISAAITLSNPAVKAVGAKEVLVLPGINPYVPFIYGLIGLIVAVVVHEISHGIIARVEGFKVKALGLLFILIPVGAFMEPDDKEVEKGSRRSRMRMFTAGPISNFIVAFLFIGIFSWGFMGSLEAPDEPFIITEISERSPLYLALEDTPKAIYSINGTEIHSKEDIDTTDFGTPGGWNEVEMKIDGGRVTIPFQTGVLISNVQDNTPADEIGVVEGSIILSIDGIDMVNYQVFHDFMEQTEKDQIINITVMEPIIDKNGEIVLENDPPKDIENLEMNIKYPQYNHCSFNVSLDDKYKYIQIPQYRDKGYIGITSSFLGLTGVGSEKFLNSLSRPLINGDGIGEKFQNVIYITFVLPLELSIMPFHDPLTEIYEVQGPLSILPDNAFWFITNTIFYVFWINILLGLFNALPMVPLDGGFVFRDTVVVILRKFNKKASEEKLEKIAKRTSKYASILVLAMILTSILFPWIRIFIFGQ